MTTSIRYQGPPYWAYLITARCSMEVARRLNTISHAICIMVNMLGLRYCVSLVVVVAMQTMYLFVVRSHGNIYPPSNSNLQDPYSVEKHVLLMWPEPYGKRMQNCSGWLSLVVRSYVRSLYTGCRMASVPKECTHIYIIAAWFRSKVRRYS